ncbi:MRP-L47-domain-containing protein [Periconia macrospinosa]|uniref:Large ribosomal subunit protein uL29m n=1 Tax=Periconia macrospinosa TaxID=97972 RepID=A0A2V1DLN1_9PLEO|nr:MRP-L47-domain-containing protein [Periconia macrospinosa]
MSAIPTFRIWRPSPASKPADAVRSLLTPASPCSRVSVAQFSSSPIQWKGKGKGDNNPNRGISPVRRTGLRPRQTLSVRNPRDKNELPVPRKRSSQIQGDPNHGLYEFFRNKQLMVPPNQEAQHGRAWSVNELRGRDWETLQQLWWVCVKERNRIATEMLEMKRLNADYQMPMVEGRDEVVQQTMKAIIDTLVERNIAYKDALKIAHQDPTVEFSRTGVRYQEQTYEADVS